MPRPKALKTQFKEGNIKTAHAEDYKIDKSDNLVLMNVFPGDNGQAASTEAYLEGEKIIPAQDAPVENFKVGTNKQLRGKLLEVYTAVTDIPGKPDLTSFRFQLSGGVKPYEYYVEKTVQNQGDTVLYKITIFFTIH